MLKCVAANKSFVSSWRSLASEFHRQAISVAALKMSLSVNGTIVSGTNHYDISKFFTELGQLMDPKTMDEKLADFNQAIANTATTTTPSSNDALRALRFMHLGLLDLGLVAILLFAFLK
jgi:hypothetical protein